METRIKELLLMGSSASSVDELLEAYSKSDTHFIEVFPEKQPNAVIAYRKEAGIIEILDLAVDPDYRSQGLGSFLIGRMIADHSPAKVTAETDDDAVDFYRKLGFNVVPFQSKWGITRYKMDLECT
jgi:ribosomal protein S18 acetylase RimI-like enzyme